MSVDKFKAFNPIDLPVKPNTGYTIGLFGASKQGKSNAIIWLWKKYFNNYITILCSPNYQQSVYKPFKSKAIITPNYNTAEQLIMLALEIQQNTLNNYKFLFILDDVITAKNNKTLSAMILTLRNSNISSIISLQGVTLMNTHIRASINCVLCFRFNNAEESSAVVERYLLGAIEGKTKHDRAVKYMKETEKHHFIIGDMINNIFVVTKLPYYLLTN